MTVALAFLYLRATSTSTSCATCSVAMGIALVGCFAFPTAPPRFLPELGFRDSVAELTGVGADPRTGSSTVRGGAVDDVAFALMLAVPMARSSCRAAARALWAAYPALVAFVLVATASHWWFDAFLGGATAAVSALAAQTLMARARPDA